MPAPPLNTPIGPLLRVVFESILEVFLICIAGYVLALKGILDKKTQKQLNRINVSIFTPSLLFSKVAFFLSPEKLRELWIVPFFFVITTTVSMIVAYLLGTAFRLKRSQRSFAMAAAMFMNSNSLPIALMQSLVITVPGLKWGEHDTRSAMIGRALTYLVLHSTLGMVLRWSYGVRLLAQADDEVTSAPHPVGEAEAVSPLLDRDETAFPPPPGEHEALRAHRLPNNRMPGDTEANVWGQWPAPDSSEAANNEVPARPEYQGSPILVHTASNRFLRPSATRKSTGVFHSFPNSPAQMATPLPIVSGGQTPQSGTTEVPTPDEGGVDEFPAPVTRTRSAPTWWSRFTKRAKAFWTAFNDFMTVPLWAALASLIVALVQPLQHGLDEHFPPIKNALDQAGKCSIPITLIVLGAYFYQPPDPEAEAKRTGEIRLGAEETDEERRNRNRLSQTSLVGSVKSMFKLDTFGKRNHEEVPEVHPGETRTVWVAVLSRMVITPLLLLPAIALSAYLDWHSVFEDPVFVVSNVLLIASPPALTLAQITQAASGDAFERLISRTIFWSYCVVTPPSTILFVVVGLLLSKL